jgi:hypothetical protein
LSSSTYSNYEQARKAWWEDVKGPEYNRIAQALSRSLCPLYDDGDRIEIRTDLREVTALKESVDAKAALWTGLLQAGVVTLNETRAALDLEPLPNGDVLMMPMGAQPTPPAQLAVFAEAQGDPTMGEEGGQQVELTPIKALLTDVTADEIALARQRLHAEYGIEVTNG